MNRVAQSPDSIANRKTTMMSGCTRKTRYWLSSLLLLTASPALAEPAAPLPIIDVHLHAYAPDTHQPAEKQLNDNENLYKASQMTCAPYENWPARDPGEPIERYMDAYGGNPECQRKFKSVLNSEELRKRTIAELERLNIVAVTSGDADVPSKIWSRCRGRPSLSANRRRLFRGVCRRRRADRRAAAGRPIRPG